MRVAVAAGGLLALLPRSLVLGASALLFAIGGIVLIRGGLLSRAAEAELEASEESETGRALDPRAVTTSGFVAPVVTSFLVLFAAEWGDLSQLLTAGLAARYHAPVAVFFGSFLALARRGRGGRARGAVAAGARAAGADPADRRFAAAAARASVSAFEAVRAL